MRERMGMGKRGGDCGLLKDHRHTGEERGAVSVRFNSGLNEMCNC